MGKLMEVIDSLSHNLTSFEEAIIDIAKSLKEMLEDEIIASNQEYKLQINNDLKLVSKLQNELNNKCNDLKKFTKLFSKKLSKQNLKALCKRNLQHAAINEAVREEQRYPILKEFKSNCNYLMLSALPIWGLKNLLPEYDSYFNLLMYLGCTYLMAHPIFKLLVVEFWSNEPTTEDLLLEGLTNRQKSNWEKLKKDIPEFLSRGNNLLSTLCNKQIALSTRLREGHKPKLLYSVPPDTHQEDTGAGLGGGDFEHFNAITTNSALRLRSTS